MTDRDLLYAIHLDPADDTRRLAYADWLDETAGAAACPACKGKLGPDKWVGFGAGCSTCHGSGLVPDGRAARAELIRVGCELARLGSARNQTGFGKRQTELAARHAAILAAGHPWARFGWDVTAGWSRGFVSAVSLPLNAFTKEFARGLFAAHPVGAVRLNDRIPYHYDSESYGWSVSTGAWSNGEASWLPRYLWNKTIGGKCVEEIEEINVYPSEQGALDALSAACVAWGNSLTWLAKVEVTA